MTEKKIIKYKSFHKKREFRLSDDVYTELLKIKETKGGTWNHILSNLCTNFVKHAIMETDNTKNTQNYGNISERPPQGTMDQERLGGVQQIVADGEMDAPERRSGEDPTSN